MRKNLRRILALLLSVVLLLPTTLFAYAGEYTWTEPNGLEGKASVTMPDDTYVICVPIEDASIINHVVGNNEVITWPTGYNASYSTFISGAGFYTTYVEYAMAQEGLSLSMSSNVPVMDFYEINPNAPAKTYSYGSEVTVCDVSWYVSVGISVERAVSLPGYYSGTIEGAIISYTDAKLIVMSD